ncbi:hypothetical protein ElyMa_001033200 [Elysia marginata]|uniref:Uncharacterized protein n=1 Tax=Elysia marginata TaxID=1093978 RepID=A0AAV4HNE8_9GAST|nr:hypothetical protein ElyMa_001033200 [Elysia marginata]
MYSTLPLHRPAAFSSRTINRDGASGQTAQLSSKVASSLVTERDVFAQLTATCSDDETRGVREGRMMTKNLRSLVADHLRLGSAIFADLNQRRREAFTPHLKDEYKKLCIQTEHAINIHLFGDSLGETIKSMSETMKLTQYSFSSRARRLQRSPKTHQESLGNYDSTVCITSEMLEDLEWWRDHADKFPVLLSPRPPPVNINTGASKSGWGGVCDGVTMVV